MCDLFIYGDPIRSRVWMTGSPIISGIIEFMGILVTLHSMKEPVNCQSLLLSSLLLNGFTFSSLFKTWVYTRTLHSWLTLLFSIKSIPAWFTILDSASSVLKSACCIFCFFRTCEICGTTARNVVTSTEAEMIEQLSETSNAAVTPQSETRSFWRGHRFLNFLLACMVFAFVISWLLHFNVPP